MSYNGSGTFNRLYSWVTDAANSIKIVPDRHDNEDNGFATGLSLCITKDGQQTITSDIPFNSKKITGLGNATADADALNRVTADGRYPLAAAGTGQFANTGFSILDTDASHGLTISPGSNLSAGRIFTLTTGDAARTLDMSGGNITVGGALSTSAAVSITGTFATAAAFSTSGANALILTTTGATNVTFPTTGTLSAIAGTETLSNKRITPRITTIVSSATPTINTDNCDCVTITALAAAITSMTSSLSGTPVNFDKLVIRIKDNGTARAITWGASFEAKGIPLPTTTVLSKVLTVGFIYDTVTSKWGCVASAQEA